jgi:Fe-S-cluster containining protein
MKTFPRLELAKLARHEGVDLADAYEGLWGLYLEVERRNRTHTAELELPCQNGCDACCCESVFLTRLELFFVWDWVQEHYSDRERSEMVRRGLGIFEANRELILALDEPPPAGERDHFSIARALRFRCPLLGDDGACLVYPVRELYARLFGSSFSGDGAVYGCHRVGEALAGKEVTLLRVDRVAEQLDGLPLTGKRQVYPYYIHQLYG